MRRKAFTLLELTVASIMLGVLVAVSVQFITAAGRAQMAVRHRQAAICEAANVMERLALRPWDELVPEAMAQVKLSPESRQSLPGAELKIEVDELPQDPSARRIAVAIHWEEGPEGPQRPVRLVAWRYRTAEEGRPR